MLKPLAGLLLMLFLHSASFAQEEEQEEAKPKFSDRVFVGGNFGLGFGDVTYIDLSPSVGYAITPKLLGGVGAIYQYTRFRRADFSSHTYGGRLFGIYKVFDPFFAQVEYEYLNFEFLNAFGESNRASFSSVLGGGGVNQPVSRNLMLMFTALYNFSYYSYPLERRPYASPWVIRVGVNIGF